MFSQPELYLLVSGALNFYIQFEIQTLGPGRDHRTSEINHFFPVNYAQHVPEVSANMEQIPTAKQPCVCDSCLKSAAVFQTLPMLRKDKFRWMLIPEKVNGSIK